MAGAPAGAQETAVGARIPPGHAKRMGGTQAARPAAQQGAGTGVPRDLQQGLRTGGLVQPGQTPTAALQQLNDNLRTQLGQQPTAPVDGRPPSLPELTGQLRQTLTTLQERAGLPQTGTLDRDTLAELARRGMVSADRVPASTTEGAQKAAPAQPSARDVYDRAREQEAAPLVRREPTNVEGLRGREPRPAREVRVARAGLRAQDAGKDAVDKQARADGEARLSLAAGVLKRELGGRGQSLGSATGSTPAGAELGAPQASAAQGAMPREAPPATDRNPPRSPPPAVTDAAPTRSESPRAERPPVASRSLDSASAQSRENAQRPPVESARPTDSQARSPTASAPARVQVATQAPMAAATHSSATEQARSAASLGLQDPSSRGVTPERADPLAREGLGLQVGEGAGRTDLLGLASSATVREAGGSDGAGAHEEPDATERDTGNSNAGDERFDDEGRGHASGDDGEGDGPGYYRVPPLSEQIWAALATIEREPDRENQITTYRWDVTLYRPDVYGPGQPAPVIFHLVVDSADAFDPVWQRAREELARHLRRLEPEQAPPGEEDFASALRRARVADEVVRAPAATPFDDSPTAPIPMPTRTR